VATAGISRSDEKANSGPGKHPKIFITYDRTDRPFVEQLAEELEASQIIVLMGQPSLFEALQFGHFETVKPGEI